MERIRNVRKRSKSSDSCTAKKATFNSPPRKSTLLKRYPARVHTAPDKATLEQHISAMKAEMSKKKPRDVVFLPLLSDTYASRRDFVTSPDRTSINNILDEYPALKLPSAVSSYQYSNVSNSIIHNIDSAGYVRDIS